MADGASLNVKSRWRTLERALGGRLARWTVGAIATCCWLVLVPAAYASSLTVSVPAAPEVGQPVTITLSGVSDGGERVWIYLQFPNDWGGQCPNQPSSEVTYQTGIPLVEGASVATGAFTATGTYTPREVGQGMRVCAYLGPSPDIADARSTAMFSVAAPSNLDWVALAPADGAELTHSPATLRWQVTYAGSDSVAIFKTDKTGKPLKRLGAAPVVNGGPS